MIGPLLTDERFFNAVSAKIPEVAEKISASDYIGARGAFVSYLKKNLDCEKSLKSLGLSSAQKPTDETFKLANDALEHNMVSCGVYYKFDGEVDWFSNHTYNNYEEWTWQLSRHAQIGALAKVYAYTKDEKYAKSAVELLHSWIKQAVAPEIGVSGRATWCWRTIEAGIRMLGGWHFIIVALLNSESASDDFFVDVFKSIYEHAERLSHDYTTANWVAMEMNGLYNIALFYPFFDKSEEWFKQAKDILLRELKAQTLDDGMQYELTFGYANTSIARFYAVLNVADAYGDKFPQDYLDTLEYAIEAVIKMVMPSGTTPIVNDGGLESVVNFAKKYLPKFPDNELMKWAASGGSEGTAPSTDTLLYPNAGLVAFRSGYTKDDIAGFFDGGKLGFAHDNGVISGHQHEDKLNFLMYCGEKEIVTEMGSFAYDSSKARVYAITSYGHNVALVNGEGQNRTINNPWDDSMLSSVEDVKLTVTPEYDYAEATYDEGYGKDAAIKATHTRRVIFVKNPPVGKPYFIVKDKLSSNEDATYDIMWHYFTEKLDIDGNHAICDELTTTFIGNGEISVYCGSEEPFRGWIGSKHAKCGAPKAIPVVYYTLEGKEAELITVFAPNVDGKCELSSVAYENGKISVTYSDESSLVI